MNPVFILSSLLAVAVAFPQDLPVVRPNHYLSQGAFQDPTGNKQHLLPQSFFTPAQQVGAELRNLDVQSAPPQQQPSALQANVQEAQEAPISRQGGQAAVAAPSDTANNGAPDSYSNIGGNSGRGREAASAVSALIDNNHYGEIIPQAFSNLQEDSYAFYQGRQANSN
ncbi:unnamed protein product [Orchesella dallaii]|uniref:Uncharacterized protein n=1 Tax=Orchesella dallaii TaxID=48710 RepID=A0ABP1PL08_9HEXA